MSAIKERILKENALAADPITYSQLFWLFLFGSVAGVLLEGSWYALTHGHWETHVVSVWGPLCIIYGIGAVGCYIGAVLLKGQRLLVRFLSFTGIGSAVELLCGLALEHGLHMRAWNYSKQFMNYKGHVSLKMALIWGIVGVAFGKLVPGLQRLFRKMQGKGWQIACCALSVLVALDLTLTGLCMFRWSARHEGRGPENRLEELLDQHYPDEWMEERFCEWRFIKTA